MEPSKYLQISIKKELLYCELLIMHSTILSSPYEFYRTCHSVNKKLDKIRTELLNKYSPEELRFLVPRISFSICMIFELLLIIFVRFNRKYRIHEAASLHKINNNSIQIICANHFSHIDYLLVCAFYCANPFNGSIPITIASDHLASGVFGYIFRNTGASFISRSGTNNVELLSEFYQLLGREQLPIFFFPEGGWSTNGNLKIFKKGMLSLLIKNNEKIQVHAVKIQSNRVFGDINFATIRKNRAWNTSDSFWKLFKALPSFMKLKGDVIINIGSVIDIKKESSLDEAIWDIKKCIESCGYVGDREQMTKRIFVLLKETRNKKYVESVECIHSDFSEWKIIFDWESKSVDDILYIIYFSFNQFIYCILLDEGDIDTIKIYEKMIFGNKVLSSSTFQNVPIFYKEIFMEMNRSMRL